MADFDLLGDPIPEGFGKRGRPPHVVTEEKRNKVMLLQAFGWSLEKIAAALSISPPTLRKNYFRELRAREEARAVLEGTTLSSLWNQASSGNVAAIKEMLKRLDKHDLQTFTAKVAQPGGKPDKEVRLGKKEALRQAAGEVKGKYAPPPPPKLFN